MVEEDTYCIDVLTQVAAASKALQGVALGLLKQHLRHCVDPEAHYQFVNASIPAATSTINHLVELDILRELTGGSYKPFLHR